MIIYKKETRELIIPNGLGNLNGLSDDAMGAIVDAAEADGAAEQKSKMETLSVTENGVYEREDGYNRVEVNVEGGSEGGGTIKVYKASDLLDIFNNGENIDYGAYYYVGGEITNITEVNTQYGNATYILDNGFMVYRGKWFDGNRFSSEDQIKVGAYIVVYGVIADYNGTLQFNAGSQVIAYQENEGSEPMLPQDGWGMVGYFNEWGGTPDIPFEESGEWEGRPYKVIRGFNAVQGEFKIRRNNAWVDSYTANFYNEPQFALLQKGDWNMPIEDGAWDIYLFFGDDGEPNEMLILYADTDLYSLQYEYTLNVYTNLQNTIILIDSSYSGMTDEYFGGSAIAVPMKYGNNYFIRTIMEGYEPITEQITCYNNEERYYTLTKIEGGDCNIDGYEAENQGDEIIYQEANWYGLDGFSRININCKPFAENKKEEGKQIVQNNLKDLDVAAYSYGDRVYEASMEDVNVECLYFNNGQRFLSNYTPILNTSYVENNGFEIIVKAKVVNGEDNGGILIGTALENDFESVISSAIILRTNIDATRLWLGNGWTYNAPTRLNEWVTYRITIDGLYISSESNPNEELVGWEIEPAINNNSWDSKVAIGGLNTFYNGLSNDYRYSGKIAKVEFKQAETYTYVPTEGGLFLQTETSSELQPVDGEPAVYTNDTEKVGEYGWKKVTVRKGYDAVNDGLDIWYKGILRIADENDAMNSNWELYLKGDNGDTLKDVFQGRIEDIIGRDAVAKPYFIMPVEGDNTVTKIGQLVYAPISGYTLKGCGVTIVGAFDCKNIQEVDSEAFKYMTDLYHIGSMNGLGESFTSPQTIDFTYCSGLFTNYYTDVFMIEFAEGLFDLSSGNQYGVNNSTLRFNNVVQETFGNDEAIAIMQNKGWTLEFV